MAKTRTRRQARRRGGRQTAAQPAIGTLFRRDDRDLAQKYGHLAAPFFRLAISDEAGQVLFSAESQLTDEGYDLTGLLIPDVSWEENDCQADMMTMTVLNPNHQLQEGMLFREGNTIDLWIGYDGHQPEYMGRVIIVEIEPEFVSEGISTIKVTGYDISYFMSEEGRTEVVAEGTRWWQAQRPRATTPETTVASDHMRETTDQANDERAQLQSDLENAGVLGEEATRSAAENVPTANIDENGYETNSREVHSRNIAPRQQVAKAPARETFVATRGRSNRRDKGKVWRNKTDAEIVEAIYESYGIVPYTQAVNQLARPTTRTITNEEVQYVSTHVSDSAAERDARRAQEREIHSGPSLVPQDLVGMSLNPPLQDRPVYYREFRTRREITQTRGGRRVVQKNGTSDLEFVKRLAQNHGYISFVFFHYESKRWIGYWGLPMAVPQPAHYIFTYGEGDDSTLNTVRPRLSMKGQKTEIDLVYVDPVIRREQRLRVEVDPVNRFSPQVRGMTTSRQTEPLGSGPEVVLSIHGRRVAVHADRRFQSLDDAREWLTAYWMRHSSEFCEYEIIPIIGLPEIHCRHTHTIRGVGRFSGEIFFSSVSHRISNGYSTTMTGYRASTLENSESQPAQVKRHARNRGTARQTPQRQRSITANENRYSVQVISNSLQHAMGAIVREMTK